MDVSARKQGALLPFETIAGSRHDVKIFLSEESPSPIVHAKDVFRVTKRNEGRTYAWVKDLIWENLMKGKRGIDCAKTEEMWSRQLMSLIQPVWSFEILVEGGRSIGRGYENYCDCSDEATSTPLVARLNADELWIEGELRSNQRDVDYHSLLGPKRNLEDGAKQEFVDPRSLTRTNGGQILSRRALMLCKLGILRELLIFVVDSNSSHPSKVSKVINDAQCNGKYLEWFQLYIKCRRERATTKGLEDIPARWTPWKAVRVCRNFICHRMQPKDSPNVCLGFETTALRFLSSCFGGVEETICLFENALGKESARLPEVSNCFYKEDLFLRAYHSARLIQLLVATIDDETSLRRFAQSVKAEELSPLIRALIPYLEMSDQVGNKNMSSKSIVRCLRNVVCHSTRLNRGPTLSSDEVWSLIDLFAKSLGGWNKCTNLLYRALSLNENQQRSKK